jgi:hypothetical protein
MAIEGKPEPAEEAEPGMYRVIEFKDMLRRPVSAAVTKQ